MPSKRFALVVSVLLTAALSPAALPAPSDLGDLGAFPTRLSAGRAAILANSSSIGDISNPGTRAGQISSRLPPTAQNPQDAAPSDSTPPSPQYAPQPPWQPPMSPQELAMRDAVRQLGKHRGRYVECHLQGGRIVTGVIKRIDDRAFTLANGGLDDQERLFYWQLTAPPRRVRATKQRTANSIQNGVLAGTIGVGIILGVIFIALLVHH